MKTVLVTGASGFAGSHFINQYGDEYKILATYNSHPIQNAKALTLQLNLSDKQKIKQLLEKTKPDAILHLAGKAKTWNTSMDELVDANVNITTNILDVIYDLKEVANYNPKIIVISSAEVYGKTTNPKSIDENSPFFPCSDYGLSKLILDRLAYVYTQTKGLDITILRSFNHTGPGQKLGFFIADMASQIVQIENEKQNELEVGNLESVRDVMDVRDVVSAYKLAIDKNLPSGDAYNICAGKGMTMQKLLEKLISLSTVKINIVKDEKRLRKSDNPISVGNNKKFSKATSWKPKISLDQTLKDCLEYWRHQYN
jgi:GDP-4-dehydro-6-deoxy-D-mannose reductase